MHSMNTSSMHSSLNQSQDKDKLWKDETDPHDVSPALLDLKEKVALLMSKELEKAPSSGEHEVAVIENESSRIDDVRGLDEDTFSLMMTSKVCSNGWFLGLITFGFQMTLVLIILYGYFKLSKDSTPFDAPIHVDRFVRVGQFFSVFLSVLSQNDLLTAVDSLAFLLSLSANNERSFYRSLIDENNDELQREQSHRTTWFVRAILPPCLKLIQSISVLLCSLIVIVESDVLIDLLKNYAALYLVSDIDNIVFRVAAQGYFGQDLRMRTEKVKNVKLEEESDLEDNMPRNHVFLRKNLKIVIFCALVLSMLGYLIYVADCQISGYFVIMKYRNCNFTDRDPLKIGDEHCDGFFNIYECGFDGNDCKEFNLKYSNCPVDDTDRVDDNFCNGGVYNTAGCNRDGGDCEDCPSVPNSDKDTRAIATGDFNNDDFVDIVVGNCGLSNQILFNNGDGTFGNATDLPGGSNDQCTTSIAVADLDGDGFDDIIIGRQRIDLYTYTYNSILWNNRGRDFTEEVLPGSDVVDTRVIEVADLDNDSFLDIIVGNSNSYNNTVIWNQKNKTFIEKAMFRSADYETRSISADLEDCCTFLFFGNYDQNNMLYGKIASDRNFGEPDLFNNGTIDNKVTISIAKFATTWVDSSNNEKRENKYIIFFNEGGYHEVLRVPFSRKVILHPLHDEAVIKAGSIAAADMNNGGLTELVTGSDNSESNRVFFISLETTTGPYLNSSIELPCTTAMNTVAIAVADLDNDGNMDIIMGNKKQKNQVLLNFLGDGKTYKQPGNDPGSAWLQENSIASRYPGCRVHDLIKIGNGVCDGYPYNTKGCGCDGGDCFCKYLFDEEYPDCKANHQSWIGNGTCYNVDPYNTAACKYDGGDCIEFNAQYPGCEAPYPYLLGDGICYNVDPYNTAACKYDGGDCIEFNAQYPGCEAPDPSILIGDGECNNIDPYNTAACKFDAGDCVNFNAQYPGCEAPDPSKIGNNAGECKNFDPYNTAACKYDGGNCNDFNAMYPDCKAPYPSKIGDGTCNDFDLYNTAACGYDGGDCGKNTQRPRSSPCVTMHPSWIGNGTCYNVDPYNTAACGYDGGDCIKFNAMYPGCKAPDPSKLSDGRCDGGIYNTAGCKYDGGDCNGFNAKYPACEAPNPSQIGDGDCYNVVPYNTAACGYDGGDCFDWD